jgi:hypothetical protein
MPRGRTEEAAALISSAVLLRSFGAGAVTSNAGMGADCLELRALGLAGDRSPLPPRQRPASTSFGRPEGLPDCPGTNRVPGLPDSPGLKGRPLPRLAPVFS